MASLWILLVCWLFSLSFSRLCDIMDSDMSPFFVFSCITEFFYVHVHCVLNVIHPSFLLPASFSSPFSGYANINDFQRVVSSRMFYGLIPAFHCLVCSSRSPWDSWHFSPAPYFKSVDSPIIFPNSPALWAIHRCREQHFPHYVSFYFLSDVSYSPYFISCPVIALFPICICHLISSLASQFQFMFALRYVKYDYLHLLTIQ